MNTPASYAIPQPLMQAVVDVLNALPAGQVRQLLNAIELTCAQQDAERAAPPEVAP